LLYCSFAIWHFKQPWWFVSLAGLVGIAVSAMAVFDLRKASMAKQARGWPLAEGRVLHIGQSRDPDGVLKVTLTYTYKVDGERFGGSESFTFTSKGKAERFEFGCSERILKVHYRPDKPELCVLDRDGMP
jgi:hypothetical protein